MKIWAISDLHLSFAGSKPMDIFGEHWKDHPEKIAKNWKAKIEAEDLVLIAGDISWAMKPKEATPDLEWIGHLPGRKVLIKGNHDYWWDTIRKVRQSLPETIFALDGEAIEFGGVVICGTRGWIDPNDPQFDPELDQKPFDRQMRRLQRALEQATNMQNENQPIILMLHYPPLTSSGEPTQFLELIHHFPIHTVIYGHLHDSETQNRAHLGEFAGICYQLVACDYLNFDPLLIFPK